MRSGTKAAAAFFSLMMILSSCEKVSESENDVVPSQPEQTTATETSSVPEQTETTTEKTSATATSAVSVTTSEEKPDEKPAEDKYMTKARQLVSKMSLLEKIGQLFIISAEEWGEYADGEFTETDISTVPAELSQFIRAYGIGGFTLYNPNCIGTESTVRFVDDLQKAASSSNSSIPLFIFTDQEGGDITRLSTGTATCGNMAVAATGDTRAAAVNASIIGSELAALGINTDLAPVMDINSDPSNPVMNLRSFSSYPEVVSEMGSAFIGAIEKHGICSAVKYFPGYGDVAVDFKTGLSVNSRTYYSLRSMELVPFKAAIEAGSDMVIVSHIQCPKIESDTYKMDEESDEIYLPSSLSDDVITGILKNDMGFDGLVITDRLDMPEIGSNFVTSDTWKLALTAGADMLNEPVKLRSKQDIEVFSDMIKRFERSVIAGEFDEDIINEAASRIVALKLKKKIIQPVEDIDETALLNEKIKRALENVGSEDHHTKELQVAKLAVTMVKNDNKTLPLKPKEDQTILYFHPYKSGANAMEYTVGELKRSGIFPESVNVDMHVFTDASPDTYDEDIAASQAVIIGSEVYRREYMDERAEEGWQAAFIDSVIETAHKHGKKVILLSMELPYDCARYSKADAILVGYGSKDMPEIPAEYNGETCTWGANYVAVIMTVFGANKPKGKLPLDIPCMDENALYTDEIMYASGTGLEF